MTRVALVVLCLTACGTPSAPVALQPAPGVDHELHVETTTDGTTIRTRITGHEVELARLPMADWVWLPMSGRAEIAVELVVPIDHGRRDYRGATGKIDVRCVGRCRLGDDQAKLAVMSTVPDIDIGHLDLDEVEIHATIGDGHATITRWTARAPDVDIIVAGQLDFARDLDDSVIAGCVRFRAGALEGGKGAAIASLIGPLASDGMHNVRIAGHVGNMHPVQQVCDGSVPLVPDIEPARVPPAPEADLDAMIAKDVRSVGANAYEIDKELVDKALADPMTVAKGARFVPAVKNGKPIGIKLYAVRPSSIFAMLGFENGDTIMRVNGFDLTSADKVLEVYTKLRDASSLQIDLERRHQPLTLTYSIR
jgi:hypothetical protein